VGNRLKAKAGNTGQYNSYLILLSILAHYCHIFTIIDFFTTLSFVYHIVNNNLKFVNYLIQNLQNNIFFSVYKIFISYIEICIIILKNNMETV